jgi:hypothetical protein
MIFYDAAKNSTIIESKLVELNLITGELGFTSIERCRQFTDPGENIYRITIIVEQVEPRL